MDEWVKRLVDDARVMGPSSIERVVWGWRRYGQATEDAHRRALEVVGEDPAWQEAEHAIRSMTEGHSAMEVWRATDEETGRTAEEAALHAALALVARGRISKEDYHALVKPMAEALPWLLPNEPPDPYPAGA